MDLGSIVFLLAVLAAGLAIALPLWATSRRRKRDDEPS
jgi:hypothetical protein